MICLPDWQALLFVPATSDAELARLPTWPVPVIRNQIRKAPR